MAARLFTRFLCFCLILVAVPLFAQQTGALHGKVTATDGSALPGVTVEARSNVLPQPRVTTTDTTGEFRLPALIPGQYTLTAGRPILIGLVTDVLNHQVMSLQELLAVLQAIAQKHSVSIANVAVRSVLDRTAVGGVIVGTRLGVSEHIQDNARVFDVMLDAEDLDKIEAVVTRSRDLFQIIGDCGDEYRR